MFPTEYEHDYIATTEDTETPFEYNWTDDTPLTAFVKITMHQGEEVLRLDVGISAEFEEITAVRYEFPFTWCVPQSHENTTWDEISGEELEYLLTFEWELAS